MTRRFAYTLPFGATVIAPDQTDFRLWAPAFETVHLEIEGRRAIAMHRDRDGWFTAETNAAPGARYRYRVGDLLVPDPASRAQADDVHGPSLVVDPAAYAWQYPDWQGRPWHEAVIYELHAGALGGFAGVADFLPHLADLGVTAVELMPIADFAGPRNWGYDGVLPYAPDAAYGTPDDLKRMIDTAHGLGLMVLLDVVYNHFGPDGNYLPVLAPQFYRHDRKTPWGDAIDFRLPEVRDFFIQNALYWLMEYRVDGLRLDAVHAIADDSFLHDLERAARAAAEPGRHIHLTVENESNSASLLRTGPDAPGYDAQWADDTHHALHVLLTGETEAYFEDFAENPADMLARSLSEGFAYQGEHSTHADAPRGEPSGHLPPTAFIICLQNHDQIGNRAFGDRIAGLADPDALLAATLVLLLSPQIPLLFMGEEWGTLRPFLYFAAHEGELAEAIRQGRRREFARFSAFTDEARRETIPDPGHPDTFTASTLDPAEAGHPSHASSLALHRDLLRIRAEAIVPRIPGAVSIGAAALGTTGLRAAWRLGDGATLTIAANFGAEPIAVGALRGITLFATGAAEAGADTLPPRSAIATLEDAQP